MAKKTENKPNIKLRQLNFLIGKWHTEGDVKKTSPSPPFSIRGIDTYEWIAGGFFILHKVDVFMGNERTEAIEIISYDASGKTFPFRSFDSQGNFMTIYGEINKKGILIIAGKNMRTTLTAHKDGNHMNALWERSEDGNKWIPWMEMKFTK